VVLLPHLPLTKHIKLGTAQEVYPSCKNGYYNEHHEPLKDLTEVGAAPPATSIYLLFRYTYLLGIGLLVLLLQLFRQFVLHIILVFGLGCSIF
jgi:hypothetical protein